MYIKCTFNVHSMYIQSTMYIQCILNVHQIKIKKLSENGEFICNCVNKILYVILMELSLAIGGKRREEPRSPATGATEHT